MLFVRLGDARWLYLGEYETGAAPALTAAQWLCASGCWEGGLGTRVMGQECAWGGVGAGHEGAHTPPLRARTRADAGETAAERNPFKEVTPAMNSDASAAGLEVLRAWSMKCVGYDEDFQHELIQHFGRG
ncbi:hypothetical protein BD413DRAFT_625309 [Trametes elegans]|nr:hypothetical protein BD413DRAFT_625309 [Trametes elegans]